MLNRRGPLSKLVGGSIGIAKEYSADRKARKEGETQTATGEDHQQTGTTSGRDEAHHHAEDEDDELEDDEHWVQDLDEAQQTIESQHAAVDNSVNVENILAEFMKKHPPPSYNESIPSSPISMPVVLPQRRPESRHRGFVRAYAPILGEAAIDQNTWFDFLDGLEKAISANAWFHVANAAVWTADKVVVAVSGVSIIMTVAATAIHVSVEAGRQGFMNYKQNSYLDSMNEHFFKPRGLYCLLVKYKPSSNEISENVDVNQNISDMVTKRDDENRSKWKNLISSSAGKTEHDNEMPDFAPLTFPALDKMDHQQQENAVKHFGHFLGDYFDRQSQAKFDMNNPDSKLAGVTPRQEFASRYSNPEHAASQGGLISIASGGNYNPKGPMGKLRDRRNARRSKFGLADTRPRGKEAREERKSKRPLKKVMKQDAIYLMVVNMPTQAEIDAVGAALGNAHEQRV